MKKKLSFIIVLLVVLGVAPQGAVHAAGNTSTNTVIRRAAPAVVLIKGYEEPTRKSSGRRTQKITAGSGFFIDPDGYVLTNRHVVADLDSRYVVSTGRRELEATVVYRDDTEDLAILKVNGSNHPVLDLNISSDVRIGDTIIGMGNARGTKIDSVSRGKVAALGADISVKDGGETFRLYDLIQTTAKLQPGDSGGPLMNAEGTVIGVNAAIGKSRRTSIGYAVSVHAVRKIVDRLGIDLR